MDRQWAKKYEIVRDVVLKCEEADSRAMESILRPFRTEAANFTLYGFIFGCVFPFVATLIEVVQECCGLAPRKPRA